MGFTSKRIDGTDQRSPAIVIDWSNIVSMNSNETDSINKMIEWVKTYPQTKDIHVYLGQLRRQQLGRKLQATLQSLGCTVSSKAFSLNDAKPVYALN